MTPSLVEDAERQHLEKQIANLQRDMDRVAASNERLISMIKALHTDLTASHAEIARGLVWRTRDFEDIEFNKPKTTEHRMQRSWCK